MNEQPTGGRTAGRLCSQEEQQQIPARQSLVLVYPSWSFSVISQTDLTFHRSVSAIGVKADALEGGQFRLPVANFSHSSIRPPE
jgi:hypothetical protein